MTYCSVPQALCNRCLLFADDTEVYSCVTDDDDICGMQQDIDNLGSYRIFLNVQSYIWRRPIVMMYHG